MAIFSGLAAAIGGLLGGTFLSGAVGSFLIKAAVATGLNLLASSLAGQPEKPTFSVQGQLQAGGDVSRSFILGTTATAGSLVYANTWGTEGKTPNAYFTQVIALADMPTRGLAAVWVNGEKCTLLTESAHADYGVPVQEYRVKGKDYLWIKFYDGTQTTADAFLVNKVGSATRPYQSTRVGVGVSYAVCTARINDKLFTGFPAYKFEVRGSKLYDITKDSTAGGSGTHRLDNPATWGGDGDDLPAVQTYSLLLGHYFGSDWFYGLQGVSPVRLPSGNWRAQINKCRLAVDKPGGGTEAQYLAGLEVQVSAPIADAVSAFLSSCQGRLIDSGGVYTLRVGAPDAAVFSFSDGDILSTEQQTFTPFFGLADTINGITATYPEPAEGWNAKAAPSLFRPDLEAKDGNRRLLANVDLGAVSRSSQVQRLIKSALEEARRARRHTLVLGPSAWPLEPGDIVSWTSQRNGYAAKLMRVDGIVDKANLDVILDLTEVDPSDYNWNPATDYVTPTYGWLGPVRPSPQEIVDWSASPASIDDAAGTGRRPAIRLAWDGDVDDVVAVAYQIRLSASGQVIYRGRTEDVEAGSILISQNLLPATGYQARGWYVPRNDRDVEPSGWLPVVTPDLRINTDDILDGAIKDLKIADRAVKTLKIALDAVKAELIANDAVIASKIANAAVTTAKFAAGIEPVSIIPGTTVPTTKTTEVVMVNGKLYRWNGTAYKAEIDAADIAGTLLNAQIESLAASKITGTLIASQIANAAITTAKFANGIEPVTIIAGTTVPTTKSTEAIMVNGKLYRWDGTAYKANVDATDIAGTLTNAQVESLAASKITGTLIASQIANAAITTAKFAAGIEPVSIIAGSTVPTTKTTEVVIVSGKLYRWSGTAYKAEVDATDIAGEITSAQIAALDAVKVTGQIAGTQISDNAISSPKLAAGSVIAGKLAVGAVLAASIASGAVTTAKLDALAVTAEKLAVDSVVAGKVAAGAINAREIAAGAVSASKMFVGDSSNVYPDFDMVDPDFYFPLPSGVTYSFSGTSGSINGQKALIISSSDTVTHNVASNWFVVNQNADYYFEGVAYSDQGGSPTVYVQLATLDASGTPTVTSAPALITSALTAKQSSSFTTGANEKRARLLFRNNANSAGRVIFSAPIIRRKAMGELIVDGSIIAIKIASGAITTAKLAAGAVVAATIASGAVTTAKLDALAVTAEKLAVDSVIAGKVAAGAINAREIAAGAVTASKMFVGDTSNVFPDFDMADPDFYAGSSGVVYSIGGTGISYNGANQMTVHPSASSNQNVFSKYFTVNQGAEYYLEAVCRASGGGDPEILVSLASVDAAGVFTTTRLLSLIAGGVNGKQTGSFATDAAETKARLVFRNRAGATAPVYFSAPVVRRKAMGELIVDGSIIALKLASGAVTTAKLAAGAVVASTIASGAVTTAKLDALAVTAEKLAVDSVVAGKVAAGAINAREIAAAAIVASKLALGNFTNMVPDSEFQDAEAWELSTGGTITTSTTSFGDGAKGMLWTSTVLDNGTTSAFLVGRTIGFVPVIAGRQYLYKYSCRRYSAGSAIVRMAFYWYDSAGALVSSAASSWSTVTTTTPQAFSGTVIVPSGATQVRIGLQIRGDSTSGVIFRSIGFNEMNAGELIVDGTIYSNALATNSVTTAKILAGAITAVELGAGAVTAIKIAAGAVTAEKINVANLAALSANFGNATFSGYAMSANGKMKLDFTAGTIEIFS